MATSEKNAVQGLVYLAFSGGDVFLDLMEQPWVLEGKNKPALESFGRLAQRYPEDLKRIMSHPTIRDGITDEEAKIVATLYGVQRYNPPLVDTLLNPEMVKLEERAITLPLAGEVLLAIIRTRPGASRTMNLLEDATVFIEEYMGVPFPQPQFNYLFEYATRPSFSSTGFSGGQNGWTAITSTPEKDDDTVAAEKSLRHFGHEISHFYWRDSERWVNEGAATFMEAMYDNHFHEMPVSLERSSCVYVRNILELEELSPEHVDPAAKCYYQLGERIFHDLYRNMDDTTFRLGFRRLYLLSQSDDPDDDCEGMKLNICHVRAAFTDEVSPETTEIANKVIDRWYDGSEPFDNSFRDDSPVEPKIPLINGKIERAYLSTTRRAFPVDAITGTDKKIPLYLNLEYSYRNAGAQTSLPVDIELYFQGDGFAFNRQSRELPLPVADTSRTESFSLGSYAVNAPPGDYRVYAYWGNQKIAEADYTIDPGLETTNIRGMVAGPNGEPLEGIGLWAWQDKRSNSGFGRTGADGGFNVRVPDGSFTLDLYAGKDGKGCSFVGRFDGEGGMTTIRAQAEKVTVRAASVEGIEIRLPAHPDDLPRIGRHCS